MKQFVITFAIIFIAVTVFLFIRNDDAHQAIEQVTTTIEEGGRTVVGTVFSVSSGGDGDIVEFVAKDGTAYQTIISIPNLGPATDFDFNDVQKGARLEITGEVWELSGEPQLTARSVVAIESERTCVSGGGLWQPAGKLQLPMCIYTYSDAGQSCSSSVECQGDCIVTESDGSDPQCAADNNPFGCKSTVEDFAEIGGIMCVD